MTFYDYPTECRNLVQTAEQMDPQKWAELWKLLQGRSVVRSYLLWILTLAQEEQNLLVNMDDDTETERKAINRLRGKILAKGELVELTFEEIGRALDGSAAETDAGEPLYEPSGADPDLDTSAHAPIPHPRQSPQGFSRIMRPTAPKKVPPTRQRPKTARKPPKGRRK